MRIAIDVMGGDHAPDAILTGSLDAVKLLAPDDQLVLIGDEGIIREGIAERGLSKDARLLIEPTTQVIAMAEPPVTALREKPDSSIVRMGWLGSNRAKEKRCDVIISAGNTGACVASAQMAMRRLPGVTRPGIAVTIPTFFGPVVFIDVGANPEPKPHHLHQYGHMGAIFAEKIVGKTNARVALLSIGGEEGKGTPLVKDTTKLMKADKTLNFVGNVEGRELFDGATDVVITEGFTGNVILKLIEGLSSGLFKTIAHELFELDPEMAMKFGEVVKVILKKHDYHEYGGAPLMGVNGVCIICHGSSEARTMVAAVRNSIAYTRLGVNEIVSQRLSATPYHPEEQQ